MAEPDDASGARDVSFTLRSPAASAGEYAVEARIWIDDDAVGTVSSIRQPGSIVVRGLPAGTHRYRVSVKLYAFDAMLQLNPSGGASGEGLIVGGRGLRARGALAVRRAAHGWCGSSGDSYAEVAPRPVSDDFVGLRTRKPSPRSPSDYRLRKSLQVNGVSRTFRFAHSPTLMESRLRRYIGSARKPVRSIYPPD